MKITLDNFLRQYLIVKTCGESWRDDATEQTTLLEGVENAWTGVLATPGRQMIVFVHQGHSI